MPRGGRARLPRKPDFSDAGYGEIGCVFIVGGMLVGSVAAIVLLPFLPTRLPASPDGLMWRLAGIAAFSFVVGVLASSVAMSAVERVRVLWKHGEVLVFVTALIAAAAVVPLGIYVRIIGEWAGSISLLAIAALLIMLLIASARGPQEPPKPPSA